METIEMRMLRKILGKTRFGHVRNQDITLQNNVQEIAEWVGRM